MTLMNNVKNLNIISRIVILARGFEEKKWIQEIYKKDNKKRGLQTSMKRFLNIMKGSCQFKKSKRRTKLHCLK